MNSNRLSLEFRVVNPFRISILVLLIVEFFLIQTWLIPSPWQLVTIVGSLIAILVAISRPDFRRYLEFQIFDRIHLVDHGVVYASGMFGDSWLRPYNEFRVDVRKRGWLLPRFQVWVNHRVLPNTVIQTTFDAGSADRTVCRIVANSRLKLLRR